MEKLVEGLERGESKEGAEGRRENEGGREGVSGGEFPEEGRSEQT